MLGRHGIAAVAWLQSATASPSARKIPDAMTERKQTPATVPVPDDREKSTTESSRRAAGLDGRPPGSPLFTGNYVEPFGFKNPVARTAPSFLSDVPNWLKLSPSDFRLPQGESTRLTLGVEQLKNVADSRRLVDAAINTAGTDGTTAPALEAAKIVALSVREMNTTMGEVSRQLSGHLQKFSDAQEKASSTAMWTQSSVIFLTAVIALSAAVEACDIWTKASTMPTVVMAPPSPNR